MLKWPDSRWRRSIQPMPFRVGQCGQKVLIIQSWKTASFTITTRRGHYFNIPKFRNIAIEISCTMGLWVIRIYKYCNLHCNLSILEGYISIIRQPEHMTSGHKNQGLFRVFVTLDIQSPPGIWTPKTYLKHPLLVILCDPFGMVKTWPFQWPSDLQIKIGDQKVASAGKKNCVAPQWGNLFYLQHPKTWLETWNPAPKLCVLSTSSVLFKRNNPKKKVFKAYFTSTKKIGSTRPGAKLYRSITLKTSKWPNKKRI